MPTATSKKTAGARPSKQGPSPASNKRSTVGPEPGTNGKHSGNGHAAGNGWNGHAPPWSHTPGELKEIPPDQIVESATNPRKVFKGLEDLAASMRDHGVVEPLLVRPTDNDVTHAIEGRAGGVPDRHEYVVRARFELVAGARRLRAAKLAELKTVPAIVRDLDDRQVREIQLIENDQRQDVHPLEQAEAYQTLIEKDGYDVAGLAAKIGRGETYVYQRLQLAKLIAPFKKMLLEERIQLGHALLLARLTDRDQEKLSKDWLFQNLDHGGTPPVKRLAEKIEREFHLNLKSAVFPKDDPTLLKDCPACTACQKRTGNNPALWPEITKEDTCTDPACFHAKERAFVQLQVKKAEAKAPDVVRISVDRYQDKKGVLGTESYEVVSAKEAKKAKDGELVTAVIVDRPRFGWGGAADRKPGQVVQIRLKKKAGHGDAGGKPVRDTWAEQRERDRRTAEALEQLHRTVIGRVVTSIDTPLPDTMVRRLIAERLLQHGHADGFIKGICERHGQAYIGGSDVKLRQSVDGLLARADATVLHQVAFAALHAEAWKVDAWRPQLDKELVNDAKAYGVDAEKVKAELKAAEKAQQKPAKGKPPAKGKKGKAAAVVAPEVQAEIFEDPAGAATAPAAVRRHINALHPSLQPYAWQSWNFHTDDGAKPKAGGVHHSARDAVDAELKALAEQQGVAWSEPDAEPPSGELDEDEAEIVAKVLDAAHADVRGRAYAIAWWKNARNGDPAPHQQHPDHHFRDYDPELREQLRQRLQDAAKAAGIELYAEEDSPRCFVCGCTESDCSGCVAIDGTSCAWVEDPKYPMRDVCSSCAPAGVKGKRPAKKKGR